MDISETTSLLKMYLRKGKDAILALINFIPPINNAGWPFIALFAIVTAFFGIFSGFLFWIGLLLTGFTAYFFRDPVRIVPNGENLIVSPADGVVSKIEECDPPLELDATNIDGPVTRISIFLNIFDVHVQRIPANGTIKELVYRPGRFLNASLDKASEHNERSTTLIELKNGHMIGVVQIAGLIARRIINTLKEELDVKKGERYGLIRFGSRVDIYLPKGISPLVIEGQRMIGGETILANFKSKEKARSGQEI